ncbi:hypothetical protein WICPIJ_004328 [Wickerhamomyces pijperi]|uniref:GTP-binding protein n=1 Tax=Wickerhamomyces pijperi TaxID=599730 RepID=A0A9P8TM53_WICPI|nr:hypothetical protein WICPIJ_004328 [Wickerhamomyces pijperi]
MSARTNIIERIDNKQLSLSNISEAPSSHSIPTTVPSITNQSNNSAMSNASKKKILLMGRSGSGKSSMRSIIFSNYSAFDTRRLGATIDVEHSHLRFLGNMTLNLWDCGGQDVFIDNYFTNQQDHIFKMCQVLIHVFDVESKEVTKDIEIFVKNLEMLSKYSSNCKIFVLLHKMDLIQADRRAELFKIMMKKLSQVSNPYGFELTGFATSIWDESLYKAWSSIVCSLIPNMNTYETHLTKLLGLFDASEIILFEKSTFLVISSKTSDTDTDTEQKQIPQNGKDSQQQQPGSQLANLDPKRFEKISNIMKNFKQSCNKLKSGFQVFNLNDNLFILELSSNLMVFIVLREEEGMANKGELVMMNVELARKYFQ